MAGKRSRIPKYGTVEIKGHAYYRTTITDSEGKQRALYAKTREELYDKELDTLSQMEDDRQRRKSPTVADYCEKWLVMQSAHVRTTTLTDYTSKVRRNIIPYLGEKKIADVTLDDIQLALVPVSKKSASVYKSVIVIYKCIFRAAEESRIISKNPTVYLSPQGGGVPQGEKQPLTDEQVQRLLDAVRELPPYVFIMLGLYAGLRREEILGLQWDSVYLDTEAPYLTVRRAWHTEHNRPVISTELKTAAAERNIPLPDHLAACLREAMELFFDSFSREYKITLKHELRHTVTLGTDIFGNIQRLDNALNSFQEKLTACEAQLENTKVQLENAKLEVQKPFPQEDELKTKTARLNELNAMLNLDKRENEIVDGERAEEEPSRSSDDRER